MMWHLQARRCNLHYLRFLGCIAQAGCSRRVPAVCMPDERRINAGLRWQPSIEVVGVTAPTVHVTGCSGECGASFRLDSPQAEPTAGRMPVSLV